MKALQSELAKKMLAEGVKIPARNGAVIQYKDRTYVVKKVKIKQQTK